MTANGKPKIAFFDFTSCEGCQLTVVDSLQTHPELLQVVEIVQFREAMSERGEDYQVAFIEGSCTRQSDEPRLQQIRQERRPNSRYSQLDTCKREVALAESMLLREGIEMLSTTHASIEEISSRVLEHLGINREMY